MSRRSYAIIGGVAGHMTFRPLAGGRAECACGFEGTRGQLARHVDIERVTARLVEAQRRVFAELGELDKVAPDEVDAIVVAMTAHLRSWRPASIAPLGTLPEPEGLNADPRAAA